jgi:hypothetical protein
MYTGTFQFDVQEHFQYVYVVPIIVTVSHSEIVLCQIIGRAVLIEHHTFVFLQILFQRSIIDDTHPLERISVIGTYLHQTVRVYVRNVIVRF